MKEKTPLSPETIGELFQECTKYHPGQMPARPLMPAKPTPPFKEYAASSPAIPLAGEHNAQPADLWDVMRRRRSRREFSAQPIPRHQLESLIWAAQGVTGRAGSFLLRTAPSAGALYPIETYLHLKAVEGLAPGLYHLNPQRWRLEKIRAGDLGFELAEAAMGQSMVEYAAATFLWTAVIGRSTWKYGQRAYRYIYLDAGHIGAHVALAAEALGLGCCAIAALYDDEINTIIGVDGQEETIVYMTVVGPVEE